MAKKLTAVSVQATRPRATRIEIPDGGCHGLYLVVQPSGRKGWCVRYRVYGRPRKLTLSGGLTLAAAREAAAAALREAECGNDPAVLKLAADAAGTAAAAAAALAADTVEKLAADFISKHAMKRTRENSWRATERIFRDVVLPAWRSRSVHDIKRRDVIDLIESVAEERPVLANRVLAALSKFFNWLTSRDVLASSPCSGVKRPSMETARDRILTDSEVAALWSACSAVGGPGGTCVKLMLLTGQRRGECAGLRRNEINGDVWTLPPARTKNGRRHDVPLSRQALDLIESTPLNGDVVFGGEDGRSIGNFTRIKAAVDAIMQPSQAFVLHDLRRTAASGMARLGIALPTIEKCLNHSGGSFRGIVQVYQRHDFMSEKRAALQRWADHVDAVVRGSTAENVVELRAGR